MKTKSLLFAGIMTLAGALPVAARAADDKPADTKSEQAASAKAAVKPHSHMEERTGMPQKAPEQTASKRKVAEDKSKHSHPRDAK